MPALKTPNCATWNGAAVSVEQRHGLGRGPEPIDERARQAVGCLVELAVGQRAAAVVDCEAVGVERDDLVETFGDRALGLGRAERAG